MIKIRELQKFLVIIALSIVFSPSIFAECTDGSSRVITAEFNDQFFKSRKIQLDELVRAEGLDPEDYTLNTIIYTAKSQGGTAKVWMDINSVPGPAQLLYGTPEDWNTQDDWSFARLFIKGFRGRLGTDWKLKLSGWAKVRSITLKVDPKCDG